MSSGAGSSEQDLGEILVAAELIGVSALDRLRREGQRTGRPLWRLLGRDGLVSEDAMFKALRQEVRAPVLAADQLKSVVVPPELQAALPHDVAQRLGILPLERSTDGRRAALAMVDPTADISAVWPALTQAGVGDVRRFLVHLDTLRLGLELFYGTPWQPEVAVPVLIEDDPTPTPAPAPRRLPSSAITQPLATKVPASGPSSSVVVDPGLEAELEQLDGPTDPGAGMRAVMAAAARESGVPSDPIDNLSAIPSRISARSERSGATVRLAAPPAPTPVVAPMPVAAPAVKRPLRREISLLELPASDLEMVEDRPLRIDPSVLESDKESVQDALLKTCEALLLALEVELQVSRPAALAQLAEAVAERLGFAPRAVRELKLVARLYDLLRLRLLRDGELPAARPDILGFAVELPLMTALRELQAVMVDFIRLPTEPDMVPLGARLVAAVSVALELLDGQAAGPNVADLDELKAQLGRRIDDSQVSSALIQIIETDLPTLGIVPGHPDNAVSAALARRAQPASAPAAVAAPPAVVPTAVARPTLLVPQPLRMPEVRWRTRQVPALPDAGLLPYVPPER